ncbi:hypothetical protein ACEWY4_017392 [Coilia grayii]|uniref:Immunoglobulin domain-containing protein n=1 Tax=Coilia grayii TaxID=363190 RepID=A0ABD1JGP2_9TELE
MLPTQEHNSRTAQSGLPDVQMEHSIRAASCICDHSVTIDSVFSCVHTVSLLTGGGDAFTVTGHEGGAVIFKCDYNKALYDSNRKYLCKGSKAKCSSNIKADSTVTPVSGQKFSLYDNPSEGNFMVLITQLTAEDKGEYYCVVDKTDPKISTVIQLDVEGALIGEQDPAPMTYPNGGSSELSCAFPEPLQHRTHYLCHHQAMLTCSILTPSGTMKRKVQKISSGGKANWSVTLTQLSERDAGVYWCGAGEVNEADRSITLTKKIQIFVGDAFTVTGHEGGAVIITCKYKAASYNSNRKYLCKGSQTECPGNIKADSTVTPESGQKFSLYDNPSEGNFMVLITQLTAEDKGEYYFFIGLNILYGTTGTNTFIYDYYTELQVIRKEEPPSSSTSPCTTCSPHTTPSSSTSPCTTSSPHTTPSSSTSPCTTSSPGSLPSSYSTSSSTQQRAVVAVCVVLAAVALLLGVIFYMHRRKRTQGQQHNTHTHRHTHTHMHTHAFKHMIPLTTNTYEEIKVTGHLQPTDSGSTAPNTVYAMAQLPTILSGDPTCPSANSPTMPSDDHIYSTADLPTNPCDDGTYSLAKLPSGSSVEPIYSLAQLPTNPCDDPAYTTANLPTNPVDAGTYALAKLPVITCGEDTYSLVKLPTSPCDSSLPHPDRSIDDPTTGSSALPPKTP